MKLGTYSLRTLLAAMAGFSFIGLVANWLLSLDFGPRVAFMIPWALGSLIGIYLFDRFKCSTLLGAMIGGMIGNLLFPGSFIIYLYFNQMNGVHNLNGVWMQLAFAACGSGLLAAIIDIPRTGLRLRKL